LVCPSPYPYQGEEWIVGVFVFYPSAAVAEKPDSGDEQFAASVDVFVEASVGSPKIAMASAY
jgi:hypothetical protein